MADIFNENENGKGIRRLTEQTKNLSQISFHDLIFHVEDGLNDIVSGNPQNNISGTGVYSSDIVESSVFGGELVKYVLKNTRACKVCFLQKLGYDARKVVTRVLEKAHYITWMVVGFSVVVYLTDEMKKASLKIEEEKKNKASTDRNVDNKGKASTEGKVYLQHFLYLLGLLKYMRQQNLVVPKEKIFEDVVNFLVLESLLCIIKMQPENYPGFRGFSASVTKADMDNLVFRLMDTYPELAVEKIWEEFPSAVVQYANADAELTIKKIARAESQEQEHMNACPAIIEKARDEVIRLLGVDSDNISRRAVVIYGQDGIGKTTIANAVFDSVQLVLREHQVSRLEINPKCSEHDIKILQQQLLHDLFDKDILLGSCVEGKARLSNAFRAASMPVFIFIDNIQSGNDIYNFLPEEWEWLPIYSRILITTTRHSDLLSIPEHIEHHSYPTQSLGGEEAERLLCKYVFGNAKSMFSSKVNIKDLTRMCNGIPLALRMVAFYLRQNDEHVSACKHLIKFIKVSTAPDFNICSSIFDFTYNKLEKPYKEAFLDIAIFFNNWERHKLVYTFPDIQLRVLEEAGLVMISSQDKLFVHNLVRERARTLSGDARITDAQRLKDAIKDGWLLSKIKGIWLSEWQSESPFKADHLDKMRRSLRVLYLGKSIKVSGECNFMFREVRFFHIYNNPGLPMDLHNFKRPVFFHGRLKKGIDFLDLTKSSRGLQLAKFLHVVELSDSPDLDRLPEGFNFFSSLEELDLSNCGQLNNLPDWLGQFKSLCKLKLEACSGLEKLPETLGDLSALEEIDCKDCSALVHLPASFGQLKSLYYLRLRGCSKLFSLPESFGDLSGLEKLDLSSCEKLKSLPDSFLKLTSLSHLQLQGCSNLISLPANIGNLSSLEELDLTGCENLSSLPENFGQLKSLRVLNLCCSNLTQLPVRMGDMSSLEQLTLENCDRLASLPNSLSQLKSLYRMHLEGCSEITEIPLPSLEDLEMTGCSHLEGCSEITEISRPSLEDPEMTACSQSEGCSEIIEIPRPSPEDLEMRGCSHSKGCSEITKNPRPLLEDLEMTGCSKLLKLPDNIEQHQHSLRVLKLHVCSTLSELPPLFGKLTSLENLVLNGCTSLKSLPPSFSQLKSLHHLHLRGASKLTSDSIAAFPSSLETADLSECSSLQSLPQGFEQHKNLIMLFLDGCSKLSALPDGFGGLNSLRYLSIAGCTELQALSANFKNLTSLEGINASGCSALQGQAIDQIVGMERLKFANIRESPMLIKRWEKIPLPHLPLMCLNTLSEMYTDIIFRKREPNVTAPRKALVWLTVWDPDLDPHYFEIWVKVSELRSNDDLDFIQVNLCRPDNAFEIYPDRGDRGPKICQAYAYAILGWWKSKDPELFDTLTMLRTFLVMIDPPNEKVDVILPAPRKGRYSLPDVDFQSWIDPKGGFTRILSPFLPFVSESVLKGTEASRYSPD